jgi:flavin-dependent dehydrogenase
VVIIEKSAYGKPRIGETLPPRIQPLLVSLGVWEQFLVQKHLPSFGIHSAWGRAELYENNFIFNPYGSGWHLDRAHFDSMLAQAAGQAGVMQWCNARLVHMSDLGKDGWDVTVACAETHSSFRTKFMVDATGRAAALARRQGARRLMYDRLIGVVGFFTTDSSHPMTTSYTLIESIERGWWYTAALPDGITVAVLMTDADLYAEGSRASAHHWRDQLEKSTYTRSFLGSSIPLAGLRIVAANSSRLDYIAIKNLLAIGDAAMAFDPLSSQGVFKAVESGLRAARAIHDNFSDRSRALAEYERAVHEDFNQYLHTREFYYSQEERWSKSIFWRRRHLAEAGPRSEKTTA